MLSCFCRNDNSDIVNSTIIGHDESHDNKSINKHMKDAEKAEQKTIKVLLLGPGSSGKTTMLKQIKRIHAHNEEGELEERRKIAKYVKSALIDYMRTLCAQSIELAKLNEDTSVHPDNECIRDEILELTNPCEITTDIAIQIKMLWNDKGIQNTFTKRSKYQMHENVDYFFERIDSISESSYVPSFEDYVRFRVRTTGFNQTKIKINSDSFGDHWFEFTDVGGQRSERSKWMNLISEDIQAIIYILAISDYDLRLFEDNKTNRLLESITLFRDIMIKGQFFKNKTIILFFNKYDLFKDKIKKTPITVAFEDFPVNAMNPNDADDAVRFVAQKFLKVFIDEGVRLSAPLHIMRTTALDTNSVEKVFGDITSDLVQHNLKSLHLI
eukprot:46141_1